MTSSAGDYYGMTLLDALNSWNANNEYSITSPSWIADGPGGYPLLVSHAGSAIR